MLFNKSDDQFVPTGLASVQMCQRESKCSGSHTTERHRLVQPNSHSCIVCHSLAVQVLIYRTRWGLSACQYTLICRYTVTALTVRDLRVINPFEVTLWVLS